MVWKSFHAARPSSALREQSRVLATPVADDGCSLCSFVTQLGRYCGPVERRLIDTTTSTTTAGIARGPDGGAEGGGGGVEKGGDGEECNHGKNKAPTSHRHLRFHRPQESPETMDGVSLPTCEWATSAAARRREGILRDTSALGNLWTGKA